MTVYYDDMLFMGPYYEPAQINGHSSPAFVDDTLYFAANPPGAVAATTIAWFVGPGLDIPPLKIKTTTPPAIALTPATLPPRIAGMAWFEPPERFLSPRVVRVEAPAAYAPKPPPAAVSISGIAWFEPRDDDRVAAIFRTSIGPAIALTPATLPARISGMAWQELPERFFPPLVIRVEQPPAFAAKVPVTSASTIAGIAWFEPCDNDRRQTLFQVSPAPALPEALSRDFQYMAWSRPSEESHVNFGVLRLSLPPPSATAVWAGTVYVPVGVIDRRYTIIGTQRRRTVVGRAIRTTIGPNS